MRTAKTLAHLGLATIGGTGVFLLTTVAMDHVPDQVLVAVALAVAFAVACAFLGGRAMLSGLRGFDAESWPAAAGGVLAFWAAPLLALLQRATDSPSGTDSAMLTTAAWGAMAVFAAFGATKGRLAYMVPAGAAAGLLGAAAVLANWERPSSLNLFVRAAERELWMVVAAGLFAAGVVLLAREMPRGGLAGTSGVALGAAAIVGAMFALPQLIGSIGDVGRLGVTLTLLGVSYGLFFVGWMRVSERAGVSTAGISLLVVPIALTALSAVERVLGVAGPDPIVWRGASAGVALGLGGLACILASGDSIAPDPRPRTRVQWGLVIAALISALLALAALALPSITATSVGSLGDGFRVTWQMLGFETAVGWVPLVAAVLSLSAVLDYTREAPLKTALAPAVTALIAVSTVPALADVPLHTWTTWIPPAVQQTYGTEYARFSTDALFSPIAAASLGLAGVTAAAMIVLVLIQARSDGDRI